MESTGKFVNNIGHYDVQKYDDKMQLFHTESCCIRSAVRNIGVSFVGLQKVSKTYCKTVFDCLIKEKWTNKIGGHFWFFEVYHEIKKVVSSLRNYNFSLL